MDYYAAGAQDEESEAPRAAPVANVGGVPWGWIIGGLAIVIGGSILLSSITEAAHAIRGDYFRPRMME